MATKRKAAQKAINAVADSTRSVATKRGRGRPRKNRSVETTAATGKKTVPLILIEKLDPSQCVASNVSRTPHGQRIEEVVGMKKKIDQLEDENRRLVKEVKQQQMRNQKLQAKYELLTAAPTMKMPRLIVARIQF